DRSRPRGQAGRRVGYRDRDRTAVTLALDRDSDRGRAALRHTDLRLIHQEVEIGRERLDHDPVRKNHSAPLLEVADLQSNLTGTAGNREVHRWIRQTERLWKLAGSPGQRDDGVVGTGEE